MSADAKAKVHEAIGNWLDDGEIAISWVAQLLDSTRDFEDDDD